MTDIIQPSAPYGRDNFASFYPSDTLISASLDSTHNYLYLRKKNGMYTLRKYSDVWRFFLNWEIDLSDKCAQILLEKANFYWVTQRVPFSKII